MSAAKTEGTAVSANRAQQAHGDFDPAVDEAVTAFNKAISDAEARLPFAGVAPVARVQWIHIDRVQANDYNPNSVAHHEMRLLHTSISSDGYTQPVVAIYDPEAAGGEGRYIIVDGFHRYTTMRRYQDIYDSTRGYLPVVVLDKPIADRMASTVRHNRARGRHSIAGMGNMVFQLLTEGETDESICAKLGMEAEELARLKHITGYSKLYADVEYSQPVLTTSQLKAKANYKREHPDEHVPATF
jgi:ParB-like chromosome segregation protein Spo0J